jgi:flavin reductase (DIM6/NTAB) family NADH-FMN oxidoreductase RutF
MKFISISPEKITDNTFTLIGTEWMLITGGTIQKHNCMTASWCGFGVLWHKPVVFVFVRPQRYTYEFLQNNEFFTLSFFDLPYKPQLQFCGTKSGRDFDKAKECNFSVIETKNKAIGYEQAKLIIECKTLFSQQLSQENFIDTTPLHHYSQGDFHVQIIAEITDCLSQ